MQLSPSQVNRFYGIWFAMLRFVNKERKLIKDSLLSGVGVEPNDAIIVRDVLWSDNRVLDAFIKANPENLSPDDLEIARSWRWRVEDTFFVTKHLKKYSVFISSEHSGSDDCKIYGVYGLNSALEDTLMFEPPCMVKTVLLPFEGKITYDSLLISYPISFGRNIRGSLNRDYQEARRRGAIIESLERAEMALVR